MSNALSNISYSLDRSMVLVHGNPVSLNNISELTAVWGISNVTETTKKIKLSANGATVDPPEIDVKLITTKN